MATTIRKSEKETLILFYLYRRRLQLRKRCQRRYWVHDILKKRHQYGEYHRLVKELELDNDRFRRYFRLTKEQFSEILFLIGPTISKLNTSFRQAIPARERLAMTLRYLATGDAIRTIAFSYRVGESTLQQVIPEVCDAIWTKVAPMSLRAPQTGEDWLDIAKGFSVWNFPNCIGALDGKHVVIQAPANTGSRYFNYKGTFSLVLLALVDASYRFIIVDVGAYGRNSDGGIFANSNLGKALQSQKLHLPRDTHLPGAPELGLLPHVIVADEAFPLKTNIMRPYPGRNLSNDKRVANYRLSRARRVVENAFGILANRWRIYHRKINLNVDSVEKLVLATCTLHNFLQNSTTASTATATMDDNVSDTSEVNGFVDIAGIGNHPTADAVVIRDKFCQYFNSPAGDVTWQYNMVMRGTTE